MTLLYLHEACCALNDGMYLLAVPVFLYQITQQLSAPFLWGLGWNVIFAILFIPTFNAAMKYRAVKIFMSLGLALQTVALLVLSTASPTNLGPVVLANILVGLHCALFPLPKHWLVSVSTDHKKIGSQVGNLQNISLICGFIAPILAGFVSYFVSFQATFVICAVVRGLSIIPILLMELPEMEPKRSFKEINQIISSPEQVSISPAFLCSGMTHYLVGTSWILAFTIFVGNILDLGILTSFTVIVTMCAIRSVGKRFDQSDRSKLLSQTTLMRSATNLSYVSLAFIPGIGAATIVDLLNKLSQSMHNTVVNSFI